VVALLIVVAYAIFGCISIAEAASRTDAAIADIAMTFLVIMSQILSLYNF
jgi:hypothetical protein